MVRSVRKFTETLAVSSGPLKRIRRHRYFPVVSIVTAILAISCLHVWQRVRVITLVHETALLRETNRQMVNSYRKVQDDITSLAMASRVERYAVDTLGMVRVKADQLFTILREPDEDRPLDELAGIFTSIKRVADNLPVVSETEAAAGEISPEALRKYEAERRNP
jgi:cell division protein FtsL